MDDSDKLVITPETMRPRDWQDAINAYFLKHRRARHLMRVVDTYSQVREGFIYRLSHDRVNIMPHGQSHIINSEVYFFRIKEAEVIGQIPEADPIVDAADDWDWGHK